MKKFTADHEWISVTDDIGTIGITDYAQEALGDIVFVDLPQIGEYFNTGDEVAVIESVKAAGEVKAPISGEVIEVNQALVDKPNIVNTDPEAEGWIYRIRLSGTEELDKMMDEEAYREYLNK